jgi:hypothetical protein
LLSREGYGLSPRAEGVKAMRAFVDGKRIGLLVAGFNTGGADPFFAPHYASERKPLKKGDVIADKFTFRFISR